MEVPNIKFDGNLSIGSRADILRTDGRKDEYDEGKRKFLPLCESAS